VKYYCSTIVENQSLVSILYHLDHDLLLCITGEFGRGSAMQYGEADLQGRDFAQQVRAAEAVGLNSYYV
jgi:hypothetical protein